MASDPAAGGRRLLVLGAGAAQLGLLEAARARGLVVVAADRDPGAPGFRLADRRALISTEDERAIERIAAAERVEGVVSPGTDWPVAVAARVADRLGLPHPLRPATAALAVSKLRQRQRLAEAGVEQPRYAVCRSAADAVAALAELGGAIVVKPADRQGQAGIGVARTEAEAAAALAVALGEARGGICLAEELLDGVELTVNAFSVAGRFVPLTVTDRDTAPGVAFGVALAHVWPSRLDEEQVRGAARAAEAAAAALGVTDGPTYTQLIVGPRGTRIVELAARLGGGHDAELCLAALGVDLNALTLAAALGEEIPPAALAAGAADAGAGGACLRFLVAPPGRLEGMAGLEEARALPGVAWVRLYREPGALIGPLRRGADRAGAVLAVGDSRAEAVERASRAAETVRFLTSDAGDDTA